MSDLNEKLAQEAAEYLDLAEQIGGCGDGGCVVFRRTGMHTNGGCRCTHRMDDARQRGVTRLLSKAQTLARKALEGKDD